MSARGGSIAAADPNGSADWGLDAFNLGPDALVLVGFSLNVLDRVSGALPAGSVLVIEEPDIIEKRRVTELAARFPAVGDILPWPYQDLTALHRLLAGEPRLGRARAVVPGVEYAVGPASVLASALGRPGAGLRAGAAYRDKYELRLLAASAGIANPEFALASGPADVEAFMRRVARPCVLKPTARQASFGVRRLASPDDVAEAWAYATGADEGDAAPDRGVPS
ncbi:MAG TPA: hypothetical protein VKX24_07160, partial [Acidimicrobiia bacterium]|nr:hypothetical protein [Acidimicrobiia bacterium]